MYFLEKVLSENRKVMGGLKIFSKFELSEKIGQFILYILFREFYENYFYLCLYFTYSLNIPLLIIF